MRSLREQGLVTSALAIVGAVTGFASNGSLEEKDRKSAAYSGGAGEVVPDIGAAGPSGGGARSHVQPVTCRASQVPFPRGTAKAQLTRATPAKPIGSM